MKLFVLGALTTTTSATTVPLDALRSVENIENDKNENFDHLMNFAKENKKITLNKDEINSLKNNNELKIWINKRNKYIKVDFPIYIKEIMMINSLSINQRKFIIQNINRKILIKSTQKIHSRKKRANLMTKWEMARILAEGPASPINNDDGPRIIPIKTSRPKFRSVSLQPKTSEVRSSGPSYSNGQIVKISGRQEARVRSDGKFRSGPLKEYIDKASKDYDFSSLTHDETEKIYLRPSLSTSKRNEFQINGKSIGLSGTTKQINNHHDGFDNLANMFDGNDDLDDVTIFNWSNQHILELTIDNGFADKTIQNTIKRLREISTIKGLVSWAFDTLANGAAQKLKSAFTSKKFFKTIISKNIILEKMVEALNGTLNFGIKTAIGLGTKTSIKAPWSITSKVDEQIRKKAIFDKIKSSYDAIIPREDINMSLTHTLSKSALTTALYMAASGASLGPIGFVMVAGISLLAYVMPQSNGYSFMSNWGDHGLNDWKFQLEKNFDNMIAIAASFSENFVHGVSWRVEEKILRSPTIWIRPGQSSDQPWILVSNKYLAKSSGAIQKIFNYTEKIKKQEFKSITESRKRFDAQKMNGEKIWEELFETYTDEKTLGKSSRFRINTPGGVEWSGSNRHYDISWYYEKPILAYMSGQFMTIHKLIAFQPNMNVHENDHDGDDAVKYAKFKSSIPDGYEIHPYEELGKIIVKFENENNKKFRVSSAWNSLLREAYANAKKWAKDVIGGDNPIKNGKRIDLSKYRNKSFYKIVPRFFLYGLDIDITKFNTYDDWGWDDTHSDKFRHAGIHISFKVVLEGIYIG